MAVVYTFYYLQDYLNDSVRTIMIYIISVCVSLSNNFIHTFWENNSHFQVACCESYDGSFVELRRDSRRQWQQFSQLIEFTIFLFPSCPGGILRFFFHRLCLFIFTKRLNFSCFARRLLNSKEEKSRSKGRRKLLAHVRHLGRNRK